MASPTAIREEQVGRALRLETVRSHLHRQAEEELLRANETRALAISYHHDENGKRVGTLGAEKEGEGADVAPAAPASPAVDQEVEDVVAGIDLSGLSESQAARIRAVCLKFPKVWATSKADLGRLEGVVADIATVPGAQPVVQPYRRRNPIMAEEERRLVQQLLELGLVTPSNSPWASPTVLVKKKSGEWRRYYILENK